MTGAAPLVPVFSAAAVRGWPDHGEGARAMYRHLPAALGARWSMDAHLAAYSAPAIPRRLTLRALDPAVMPDGVTMVAWVVDVDDPATHAHNAPSKRARRHLARARETGADVPEEIAALAARSSVTAGETWREDFAARVERLRALHPAIGAYQTRGGGRLVAWLATPRVLRSKADARAWAAWHALSLGWLSREFGIEADPLSREWSRLFRLPHATRDGAAAPESWAVHALPSAPWDFTPGDEDRAALRALADAGEAHRAEQNGRNTWREALRETEPEAPRLPRATAPATAPARAQPSPAPRGDTGSTAQPAGSGNGRAWADVSPREPCPVCGGDSWCQIARDGLTVLCKRVESGRARVNRAGVEFHVHHLGDGPRETSTRRLDPVPLAAGRASPDDCDRAYRAVLSALTLDAADREGLARRGLSPEDITANGYRSLAVEGRARLARAVVSAVGEELARRVPGIVRRDGDRGPYLSFGGSPGVIVPCRDMDGRIVALKVRRRDDDPREGARYLYVTSAKAGGASAPSVLHVPELAREILDNAPGGAARLVVTEGELKADLVSALSGDAVCSIPGVGSWRLALDAAARWRPRAVCVALDMDGAHNPAVAHAAHALVNALRAEGHAAALWRWDRRFKGLDDYLVARRRGEV